VVAIISAGTLI